MLRLSVGLEDADDILNDFDGRSRRRADYPQQVLAIVSKIARPAGMMSSGKS